MSTGFPWAPSNSAVILDSFCSSSFAILAKRACKFLILCLFGQRLRPIQGEIKMASAIIDLAYLTSRRFVAFQEFRGGSVEGIGQDLRGGIVGCLAQML